MSVRRATMADSTAAMVCPCCESGAWHSRWPGFLICSQCGLMTVAQSIPRAELRKLYQEDYFQGREYIDYLADKAAQQKTLASDLRVMRRHVPSGSRVLEIGCAHGFFLELIKEIYPYSVGVDVSSTGIAHARSLGLDAREADLLELTFDRPFDAVCLWDTIEHLPNPYEVMRRAVEWLRPGGHLFLTTGDFGALLPRLQGLNWRQIHPPTHLFYFTRPALRALCRRLGLEVVSFSTVRVYRRVRSALQSLERLRPHSPSGRIAKTLLHLLPAKALDFDLPLNLGDTLRLAAQKR